MKLPMKLLFVVAASLLAGPGCSSDAGTGGPPEEGGESCLSPSAGAAVDPGSEGTVEPGSGGDGDDPAGAGHIQPEQAGMTLDDLCNAALGSGDYAFQTDSAVFRICVPLLEKSKASARHGDPQPWANPTK